MLTAVEVVTSRGENLVLPLQDASSGYAIANIDGLDQVDADLLSTKRPFLDGELYQGGSRGVRNIVLTIDIVPDYVTTTVDGLRKTLVQFFRTKSTVRLYFHRDTDPPVYILGVVESFEAERFTTEPTAQISIVCFNPDFISEGIVEAPGLTTPGTSESLIHYEGTIETGFNFSIQLTRTVSRIDIINRTPHGTVEKFAFDIPVPLEEFDVVMVSTVNGNKGVTYYRDLNEEPGLAFHDPSSGWPKLYPGDNYLRVVVTGTPAIAYELTYQPLYGEV